MPELHLIGCEGCGSAIVEAMLGVANIPYEYEEVDYSADSPTRARLLEVNPLGQVPALVLPDGTVMTESAAMAFHIDDLAPKAGLVPPAGSAGRAKFLRWLVFLVAAVYPTFTFGDDAAKWVDGDEAAAKLLRSSSDKHRKTLMMWVEQEVEGPWFLGERFSAIDLYIAIMTYWRPGRKWYGEHCPKLMGIAAKAAALPPVGEVVKRNLG